MQRAHERWADEETTSTGASKVCKPNRRLSVGRKDFTGFRGRFVVHSGLGISGQQSNRFPVWPVPAAFPSLVTDTGLQATTARVVRFTFKGVANQQAYGRRTKVPAARLSGLQPRFFGNSEPGATNAPVPQGPRPPIDVTGPRLPRMVQAVTAARCYNCSTPLPGLSDFPASVPSAAAALHCCKQCCNFEPSTRFQCLKPVPVRIAVKDQANECELFKPRVTVAREAVHGPAPAALPPTEAPPTSLCLAAPATLARLSTTCSASRNSSEP